jgi:transglutaminase-like putative cysteine protease
MFLLNLLFLLLFPRPVFAADEFQVNQNTQYQIDLSGNANVSQEIELTNNYSQIYPKEYQITLSSNNIENIIGSDSLGNIVQKIDQRNDQTIIYIQFNQANVGKDQVTKFNLTYFIPSLATQKGNTWEVALPENQNTNSNYNSNTTINLPESFGSLSFSSVSPQSVVSLNNQTQVSFNSSNSQTQKILLIFGDYQLFDFKFKYFLENTKSKTDIFQIALPPETDSQKIVYRSIDPPPQNITIDSDGNYLAQYQISPQQKINIMVDGQVKIIHSNSDRATINNSDYLKSSQYWPTNDPDLKTIAAELSTPKSIYDYVINTLSYKYDNIDAATRQGASLALANPTSALCTEFTDLFVTLARIKNIPAREVEGFAYSNNTKIKPINTNTDVLHAWPQYYDSTKNSWISIDPTWGKTTNGIDFFNDLDPNHFAFVFHGLSSTNPLPPGAYKNNQDVKTVDVEFAKTELKPDQIPLNLISASQKFYQPSVIKIQNSNYNSISQLIIFAPKFNWQKNIENIPPLSSLDIPFPDIPFLQSLLPQNYKIKINLQQNGSNATSFEIKNPKYFFNIVIFLGLIITLTGFSGIIFTSIKKHLS